MHTRLSRTLCFRDRLLPLAYFEGYSSLVEAVGDLLKYKSDTSEVRSAILLLLQEINFQS